jgi:hypothetical protein
MKRTVTNYQFHRAFEEIRPDNFSYSGLDALFKYLEEIGDDTGEEIELDVIGICCDFAEYDSLEQAAEAYGLMPEELPGHTAVIEFDGGVIVQAF